MGCILHLNSPYVEPHTDLIVHDVNVIDVYVSCSLCSHVLFLVRSSTH